MTETVLIVGAGPVGLTAAVELWRQGVQARIITKAEDFATESRAIGINPVSLSLLEASGASEKLIAEGTKIEQAYLHFEQGGVASLNFNKIDSKYNYILALPQSRTERILNKTLQELGGRVEHGTALERLEQIDDIVRCHVRTSSGPSVIEAQTVIGADGAHSICRKSIGVEFPGETIDGDWTIADVRLDWEYPHNELHGFVNDDGFFMAITMGNGMYRLACASSSLDEHIPPGATITEEIWRSKFRVHHRQATSYQVGRVFLAGDAAHIHSPVGGRGMNLGIKDAVTLTRLLIEGREAEYTGICHPDGAKTIAVVRRQTMAMGSKVWWLKRIMGVVVPAALNVPFIHNFVSGFVTNIN